MKSSTHKQRSTATEGTALEQSVGKLLGDLVVGIGGGAREFKPVLLARNLTLNCDAAPCYKYVFGSH